jgi:hypothetical protein
LGLSGCDRDDNHFWFFSKKGDRSIFWQNDALICGEKAMKLTGNKRYRKSIFGALILQVEERGIESRYSKFEPDNLEDIEVVHWRDADEADLSELGHDVGVIR